VYVGLRSVPFDHTLHKQHTRVKSCYFALAGECKRTSPRGPYLPTRTETRRLGIWRYRYALCTHMVVPVPVRGVSVSVSCLRLAHLKMKSLRQSQQRAQKRHASCPTRHTRSRTEGGLRTEALYGSRCT